MIARAQLVDGEAFVALLGGELGALPQHVHGRRVVRKLGRAAQVRGQGVVVAAQALHVRQVEVDHGVLGEEVVGPPEPVAGGERVAELLELHAPGVVGDGEPGQHVLGELVAALLEVGVELPLARGLGVLDEGLEGLAVAGIVSQRASVEVDRTLLFAEVRANQPRQPRQDGCPLRALDLRRRVFERGDGLAVSPLCLVARGQAEQRREVAGLRLERPVVQAARLVGVFELLEPQAGDLGVEGGLLEGAHRELALGLGHLEHGVPLLAVGVDAAHLDEGGAQAGVQPGGLLVARQGGVAAAAALVEHLSQAQHQARTRGRGTLRHERGRVQALLVERDQGVPLAGDEVGLFEASNATPSLGSAAKRSRSACRFALNADSPWGIRDGPTSIHRLAGALP